jgi:ribosomal protein S12 methylthiotransferase
MNRRGTAESYLSLVQTIRRRLKRAVIRSTFLVGFPGETEADFAYLLDFQEKLRLDWLGCFSYSREEDTPAYAMKGQVAKKTAAARKREIELRQITITEKNMDRFVGENLDILLEEPFKSDADDDTLWLGRLYCHAPEVDGAAVLVCERNGRGNEKEAKEAGAAGDILPCKVIARRGLDLEVRLKR